MCFLGVIAHSDPDCDTFYLGNAFLRNYLAIFDLDNERVGLAIPKGVKSAVRATFSGGMIALIAISVAILFPLAILAIYFMVLRYKKAKKLRISKTRTQLEENLRSALAH